MAKIELSNIEIHLSQPESNPDQEYYLEVVAGDQTKKTSQQKFESGKICFSDNLELDFQDQESLALKIFEKKEGEDFQNIAEEQQNLSELKENNNEQKSLESTLKNNEIEYKITYKAQISKQTEEKSDFPAAPPQAADEQTEQPQQQQEEEQEQQNQEQQQQTKQEEKLQENERENTSQTAYKFVIEGIRAYIKEEKDKITSQQLESFCVLTIGSQQQKTSIISDCGNRPEWQDQFKFLVEQEKTLEIELYEKMQDSQEKEELLGKAIFKLDQYQKNQVQAFKSQKNEISMESSQAKQTFGNIYFDLHSYPPLSVNSNNNYQEKQKKNKKSNVKKNNRVNTTQDQDNDDTLQDSIYNNNQDSRNINQSQLGVNRSHCSVINGFGTSEFHSASSLQHSIPSISFTKQKRWNHERGSKTEMNTARSCQQIKLPSLFDSQTISGSYLKKGTYIGYGKKQMNHPFHDINAKQNPSPADYVLTEPRKPYTTREITGKEYCTFGCSREDSGKLHMPNSKLVNPKLLMGIPGPNQYQKIDAKNFGKNKSQYTIQKKPKPVLDDPYFTPSPLQYTPQPVYSGKKIGCGKFGYGERGFKPQSISPGPAQYNIPSKFDKYTKYNMQQKRIQSFSSAREQ